MQQINVFFKPGGNVSIDREIVGVHSGDSLMWEFHSVDPKVKWVDVVFDKLAFFADRGGGVVRRRYVDIRHGHGHLFGTAPQLPATNTVRRTRIDKYSVRGYETQTHAETSAKVVSKLDPEVIICDP